MHFTDTTNVMTNKNNVQLLYVDCNFHIGIEGLVDGIFGNVVVMAYQSYHSVQNNPEKHGNTLFT